MEREAISTHEARAAGAVVGGPLPDTSVAVVLAELFGSDVLELTSQSMTS
jgi:hypothetical protein